VHDRQERYYEFRDRCKRIVADTSGIGWGFHDMLSEIYDAYFPDDDRRRHRIGASNRWWTRL